MAIIFLNFMPGNQLRLKTRSNLHLALLGVLTEYLKSSLSIYLAQTVYMKYE